MRIAVLASSYPRYPGDGTAPFVQSLSEHLAVQGHAVEVIAPYDPLVQPQAGSAVVVHRFRYAPFARWHIMGHARALTGDMRLSPGVFPLLPAFLLAEFRSALRLARRQPADLVHAHWVLPNGLVGAWVARAVGVPLALSLHGSDVFVARRNRAFGRVAGWVFRQAAVVTACSDELRRGALQLGALPERVHLVAWGADPDRFTPTVRPDRRADFGLAASDIVVAGLGRLVSKKGFHVLVAALPALRRADPRVRVVIGGEGPQREVLSRLAAELGVAEHVRLPGQISWDRVPGFLAMGDVFALPSVRDAVGNLDGLPTVLIEALALGKPVAATRIGGTGLVIDDGVNGLLCEPGDPEALSVAISRLLRDPDLRTRLGSAARISVEERYNWNSVARRLAVLFQDALDDVKCAR